MGKAWLIQRNSEKWVKNFSSCHVSWTDDPIEALQFARRRDAYEVIKAISWDMSGLDLEPYVYIAPKGESHED